ncbi:MAG: TRAP transporter large permease [Rhodospirillales bacterium]|nr:TRAP transporter large permease [Rhodospirillales bacterium]
MIGLALVILVSLMALSIPVAVTLLGLSLFMDQAFSRFPLHRALGEVLWSASDSFLLIAIPLFILLGEILVRTGIARRTYGALEAWLSWLPGGLLHANIGTATFFSATSGSSVATAATVGTVAMPQARALGYHESLFAGSIAAGGTLGIMIPPSINLIVYGFLTETSIPRLFIAGIIPGVALALSFIAGTVLICSIKPQWGGPRRRHTWRARLRGLVDLLPVFVLFSVIIGSIYTGWATPTEAAAVGVLTTLAFAVILGELSIDMLKESLAGTMRTSAMIMLIITSAYFLNFVLSAAGATRALSAFVENTGMGPTATMLLIIGMYVILGFFVETLSLMVITIPVVEPVVVALGYDPIWFGIMLILLIEMALITPPVGLNLYVVQGVRGRGSLNEVMIGALPYAAIMLLMAGVLLMVPDLALFLPRAMN